jgi:glutamate transport system permease protein
VSLETGSNIDTALNPSLAGRPRPVRSSASVLYDAPGPRTRRLTWIGSVVAAVALLVLAYWFVYRPLDGKGQFDARLWNPIVDPDDSNFTALWQGIGRGLGATLRAAGLAIATSLACGLGLAVLRIQLRQLIQRRFDPLPTALALPLRGLAWALNGLTRVCVEVFRGMPVLITIFFVARGLPELGVRWPTMWFLVVGLTLYNMVVIGEIVRSGIEGLPKGQREAAASLGLSTFQTTRLVLLPQAVRIMLPAVISQLVVVLKDTSLGFIILYPDLLFFAKTAALFLGNPIPMFFVCGLVFLLVNYTLSRLATFAQQRL